MQIQTLTALSTWPKALGVMSILITAAQLPQENWARESWAFVVAVMPLKTRTSSSPYHNPRDIPGDGTCVPAHLLGWRKQDQEVLEIPNQDLRSRVSIFTFYTAVLDLKENLFVPSVCMTFVHLWTRHHKVLKPLSVWNTLGTLGGKCHSGAGLSLLLFPTWAILWSSRDVWCLPDTELTDNLFNRCGIKKKNPASS